jgi:hypothetical protein
MKNAGLSFERQKTLLFFIALLHNLSSSSSGVFDCIANFTALYIAQGYALRL